MALNLQTETLERPLTLSNIMPTVRMLPTLDKLKLIRVLAEDVEKAGDVFPFETEKTYQFSTPYETYGAAEILLECLERKELEGWLKLSESSCLFWNNEKDATYDVL